jgi:hypothetical protein
MVIDTLISDIIVMVTDENQETIGNYVNNVYKKLKATTKITVFSVGENVPLVIGLPKLWEGGLLKVIL